MQWQKKSVNTSIWFKEETSRMHIFMKAKYDRILFIATSSMVILSFAGKLSKPLVTLNWALKKGGYRRDKDLNWQNQA